MKIDLGPIAPPVWPQIPGGFYVRSTRWGLRAQAWPRPGSHSKKLPARQHRTRFGFAARMASTPTALEYQTAVHLSEGTEQVPRDLLTAAALGQFYIVELPDGTLMPPVTGSLAYQATPRPSMSWEWSLHDSAWSTTMNTGATASKGAVFTPPLTDTFRAVRFIFTAVAGATYKASHGWVNGSNVIQAVTSSPSRLAAVAGLQVMEFDLDGDFYAAVRNFLLVTRTDGTATYALPIQAATVQAWQYPVSSPFYCILASTNPAIGNTLSIGGATRCVPVGFLVDS